MRVTLRTILAYLDDILEPGDARDMGEKIADSKEAAALVSRIRDVMRRRRIGAPELAGPGSGPDPNIVSDYLENLLPADQVVELERLCQASDVHLAEVAASHKVLSMVMGHPMDVPDEMRERMYALGSARAPGETVETAAPAMAEGMAAVQTETESGLPEYLTRRSFAQQYGVFALIAASTLFWIFLVWTDPGLWSRREIVQSDATVAQNEADTAHPPGKVLAPNEQPVKDKEAGNSVAVPVIMPAGEVPAESTTTPPITPAAPEAIVTMPASNVKTPPAPAAEAETPAKPTPPAPAPATEQNPAMPIVASPTAPKLPPMPANGADEMPPERTFAYQSGDEFVIKKLATHAEWLAYPITIPIEVEDEIASPPPFRNTYGIVNVIDVAMEPVTRLRRLPRTKDTELGLELNRGQILLTRPLTAPEPVTIELHAAKQSWRLTFLDPGSQCAVEVVPPHVSQPGEAVDKLIPEGGLVVITGRVRVSSAGQPEIELGEKNGFVRWPNRGTALVMQSELGVPAWAQPNDTIVTPAARQLARLFQKEFIADRTVAQCIGPVIDDRRAGISELAVKTLGMIDQYSYLVPALQSNHQESRLAAIRGLREWLAISPDHQELLQAELGTVFRAEYVPTIMRLLQGYTEKDARDPATSRQLIDWLKDDQIAIRQLAFDFVSRTVGKTYDYMPMAPQAERRAAVTRWEEYLKRAGGTLLPQESSPAP